MNAFHDMFFMYQNNYLKNTTFENNTCSEPWTKKACIPISTTELPLWDDTGNIVL